MAYQGGYGSGYQNIFTEPEDVCGYPSYTGGYNDPCDTGLGGFCAGIGYAGGMLGGAAVFGGFGYCSETIGPPEHPPVNSNVLDNLDTSRGRLGCGEAQFFITGRCSSTGVLCVLDGNVTSAHWDRRLDEVSEAEVEMTFGGDQDYTCCECLANIEPWCHELHIWRDGEEVWVGPIISIEYSYEGVKLRALDSLAWLSVRIPAININFTDGAGGLGAVNPTEVAEYLLTLAFAEDSPTFTCEMDNLYSVPVDTTDSMYFFEKFTQTALEILLDLADQELDFTTLGRTILLFGNPDPLVPLVLLNDEYIMGDVTITKDGGLQGNRFYVHFEEDAGIPAMGEADNFYCSGPIEKLRDGDGLTESDDAEDLAELYVSSAGIAPRILEVPEGSKLSPDTPWTINQMVPGTRVDVAITKLCLSITQSFLLKTVEVEYGEEGEMVRVSLVPITEVAEL